MNTAILTPFECGSFTKLFSKDRAQKYFSKNMVVFFAGGTGHPYFSTDMGMVLFSIEINADVILAAKSIDGVYDSDPEETPDAKKFDKMKMQDIVDKQLKVIDLSAAVLANDNKMPMMLFGLNKEDSIVKTVSGEFTGTTITVD